MFLASTNIAKKVKAGTSLKRKSTIPVARPKPTTPVRSPGSVTPDAAGGFETPLKTSHMSEEPSIPRENEEEVLNPCDFCEDAVDDSIDGICGANRGNWK